LRPTPLYNVLAGVSWPILYVLYRLHARGRENLPSTGGYVLACNHVSSFDPWPLGLPLWPKRFLRFMAKSELYWFPMRLVLNGAGAFPVRRGQADIEAIGTAVRLAREGHVIAMFPEGTRRRKGLRKKHTAQAHSGAARIAIEAGVPLVPAGIKGTDGLRRLEPWRVRYGDAVTLSDDAAETTERLMTSIRALEDSL
jgi:1-acyl-sn-glycerol-3-phosphate acyltransferase